MKKQIMIILLLAISATSFSQITESSKIFTNAEYLKKSRKQNTAGWIFLGSGFALSATGLIIGVAGTADEFVGVITDEKSHKWETAGGLFFTGLASMLTSIPFFVSASKNKKKANGVSASFKFEKTQAIQYRYFTTSSYPAIAFKINL